MNFFLVAALAAACAVAQNSNYCEPEGFAQAFQDGRVASFQDEARDFPERVGESVDVKLSADAALVWDIETGRILYEKNANKRRPVASLNKLLTVLTVREKGNVNGLIEIPVEAKKAQRLGAHVALPAAETVSVEQLLAASLIASANDAAVALAVATSGSEAAFVEDANELAVQLGFTDTKIANATGLNGGDQYSTARDVMKMMNVAYDDVLLRPSLTAAKGTITTIEGTKRSYRTTNKLLGTYMPIHAAKTGYTREAGQNLVIITSGAQGQKIGAVVLGSDDRFFDMKALVAWTWKSYNWGQL